MLADYPVIQDTKMCIVHPPMPQNQVRSQAASVDEYKRFFLEFESLTESTLEIKQAFLDEHGIRLTSKEINETTLEQLYRIPRVLVMNVQRGASIIDYDILLGPFAIAVRMLNVNQRTFDEFSDCVGKGSFGSIVVLSDDKEEFVSKRIKFRDRICLKKDPTKGQEWYIEASFSQVKEVLVEYAFTRVCSMLGVGPRLKRDIGFDLVCYRDCIEFFMEKCEQIDTKIASYGWSDADSLRLKHCVRVMHCHHLIHRDVKPANIVWSPHVGQYVLCDFGIACIVAERTGFKSQTDHCGTESYMSKEMLELKEEGLVDLYHNDMHALALSLYELASIKSSNKQLVYNYGTRQPTKRIMLFKALSNLLKSTSMSMQTPCLTSETSTELRLAEATALIQAPKVQFLLNSMEISFELQTILEQCQSKDERMNIVAKMVSNLMGRPLFVKRKYQELEQLGKRVFPARLREAKDKELMRLNNSLVLSPEERTRHWMLLAEHLVQSSIKATTRKPIDNLLKEFKSQSVTSDNEFIAKRVDVLFRLRSGQLRSIYEQVQELDQNTLCCVVNYLFTKGEYKTCFEVILHYGGGSSIKNYDWLLQNLLICYEQIGEKEFLNQQILEVEFDKAEVRPESWDWLKQFNLLAIALLYKNPEKCCQLCLKYIDKVKVHNRRFLIAVLVKSDRLLERIDQAISWQLQLINLRQYTFLGEQQALFQEKMKLLEIKEDLPSVNIDSLIKEALALAHEQKRKFGPTIRVLTLNNRIASLLIRQKKFEEADILLSSIEQALVNENLGKAGSILYHCQKIDVKCEMIQIVQTFAQTVNTNQIYTLQWVRILVRTLFKLLKNGTGRVIKTEQ